MQIRITIGNTTLTATLNNCKTTQNFISLLPLTMTMNDRFLREKYGHLPRAISGEGERTHTYEVGNIAYWSPGPDVGIYYRQDGEDIPALLLIIIGKIDPCINAFHGDGLIEVTVERTGQP